MAAVEGVGQVKRLVLSFVLMTLGLAACASTSSTRSPVSAATGVTTAVSADTQPLPEGWSVNLQSKTGEFISPQCPTARVCYLVRIQRNQAVLMQTTNGGKSWSARDVYGIAKRHEVTAASLACPEVSRCWLAISYYLASGAFSTGRLFITDDGGATWRPLAVSAHFATESVDCGSARSCVVSGVSTKSNVPGYATSDGGAHWQAVSGLGTQAVWCDTARLCVAAGFGAIAAQVSHDGGLVWHDVTVVGGKSWGLYTVSEPYCDQFTHPVACYASVSAISTTDQSFSGVLASNSSRLSRWHRSLTMATGFATGISGSCSSAFVRDCIVAFVGVTTAANTTDFYAANALGTSWHRIPSPPKGTGTVRSISCVTGTRTVCWVLSTVGSIGGLSLLLRYEGE